MDLITGTFKVTVGVLGWVVSVPGKVWSLRKWSRDDWSGWWSGIKKTVKDEAHHYWVSRAQHNKVTVTTSAPATTAVERVDGAWRFAFIHTRQAADNRHDSMQ
jgi:hypothetical protein